MAQLFAVRTVQAWTTPRWQEEHEAPAQSERLRFRAGAVRGWAPQRLHSGGRVGRAVGFCMVDSGPVG